MLMDLLCNQAIVSLDHTAQKERSKLAHCGKLGKRRRPSRANLKATLYPSTKEYLEEIDLNAEKKLKNDSGSKSQDIETVTVQEESTIRKQERNKGSVIEIGRHRTVEGTTIIHIGASTNEIRQHEGPIITGALLKSPERRKADMKVEFPVNGAGNDIDVKSDGESENPDDEDDINCRRWKSLSSLWQTANIPKEPEKEEEAPWVHEVKLRHVEDPEVTHKGCSMLFFGPLPKSHKHPDGSYRRTTISGNSSQLPVSGQKDPDVIYRQVRPRPVSICEQVQIQTWDRRRLTGNVKTTTLDRKHESVSNRNDTRRSNKNWQDIPLITDASQNDNRCPEEKIDRLVMKRPKPRKRWKNSKQDGGGVRRSKSLNGIDKEDEPEWIELSKRLTSKNIDWDNLPTRRKGSQGRNHQNELRVAWKKMTNENIMKASVEKEEFSIIPNGFTKTDFLNISSKKFSHSNKLDAKVDIPPQNSSPFIPNGKLQKLQIKENENVAWIKEAEKRRQKYINWQSNDNSITSNKLQNSIKSIKHRANQDPNKISFNYPLPNKPQITKLIEHPKSLRSQRSVHDSVPNVTSKLAEVMIHQAINHSCIGGDLSGLKSKSGEGGANDVREEPSPFLVKLRRVRCAKPEECYHEIKCQQSASEQLSSPESASDRLTVAPIPIESQRAPIPTPRNKKSKNRKSFKNENDVFILEKNSQPKIKEETPHNETFSVQLPDSSGDNFYIVINDQEDSSFLQVEPFSDVTVNNKSVNEVDSLSPKHKVTLSDENERDTSDDITENSNLTTSEMSTEEVTTPENETLVSVCNYINNKLNIQDELSEMHFNNDTKNSVYFDSEEYKTTQKEENDYNTTSNNNENETNTNNHERDDDKINTNVKEKDSYWPKTSINNSKNNDNKANTKITDNNLSIFNQTTELNDIKLFGELHKIFTSTPIKTTETNGTISDYDYEGNIENQTEEDKMEIPSDLTDEEKLTNGTSIAINEKETKPNGITQKSAWNKTYENVIINGIGAIPVPPRRAKNSQKLETVDEKASRMTSDICNILSSLGRPKTEIEKKALYRDILKTLICPSSHSPPASRTLTLVTCDEGGVVSSSVEGQLSELASVGVQTNCDDDSEMNEHAQGKKGSKKPHTKITKKTVKIIIHECDDDDDDEKKQVVEEIIEEILEPRSQKGKMVKTPSTIFRTVEETEDGQKYLTTTVTDGCTFCVDDSS